MTAKDLYISALFILFATALHAQNLSGYVVGKSEKPLPSATIALVDTTNKAIAKALADSSGRFTLSHHTQGVYTIVITYTGYDQYRSMPFDMTNKDFGIIRLTTSETAMDEVTVQAKQRAIEVEGGNIIFNVAKTINAQGTDALEVLRKAPGIFVDNQQSIFLNGKQGALILIDGRQTYVSGKELTDLLRSMPASAIKSIEIINTPSAKYDAGGSAGIINIRTNKITTRGFNGSVTTGVSYGISLKQNQDLSFNYRNNKVNVFGMYNHFVGNYNYVYGSVRTQQNKVYDSHTDDTDKRKKMGTRLGIDYNLSKRSTLGILLNGNFVFGGGITHTKTAIGDAEQFLDAVNDYYFQQTNRYNMNLNYRYESGSGTIINIDADYGTFDKGNGNLQSNIYTDAGNQVLQQNLYRSLNDIDIQLKAFKFDYTAKVFKGTLEAGVKYADVGTANKARFLHVLASQDSLDDRRSNAFSYSEQVSSSYLNYKKAIGIFNFQGGLRMEHTTSDGTLQYKDAGNDSIQHIKRNYTDLFPSTSVSLRLHEHHDLSLAFSRRIDRPAYQDLNPFVYLLDELSFWQGNPFLQPQYTNKLALQYVFKSATIATLSYLHSTDYSARITDTLGSSKILMIPRNLGNQKIISFSLTQNWAPRTWWDISFSGTLNHVQNNIAFDRYRNMELRQLAGRLNVQQRFKLPFSMIGEVSGYMSSRKLSGANEITRGLSQIDLGLQKTILHKKGTLRLAFTDIYKGSKATSRQQFDGFTMNSYSYYETRQVRLNFTYKFADGGIKDPRSRNSALENEQGRIK